jgi:hypothetical protein
MSNCSPSPEPQISAVVVEAALSRWADFDHDMAAIEGMRAAISAAIAADREASRAEIERLKDALKFYANPQIYEPDSVGRVGDLTFCARSALSALDVPQPRQLCAATISADPPQDCNWPFCGCDEKANKVLEALEECGVLKDIDRLTKERDEALAHDIRSKVCMGVGDGSGQRFVYGDYESIKTVQAKLIRLQELATKCVALKKELSLAEQATRTALESIPIAMTAAAEKEREACAAVADDVAESPSKTPLPVSDDESNDFDVDAFDSGCVRTARRIATAIRNRSEAK